MIKIICMSLTLLVVLLTVVAGATDLNGSCQIRFRGDSTLHGFSGVASCEPFTFQELDGQGTELMFQDGSVRVAVKRMDTDNDSRDASMFKMFDADHFPFIIGHFPQFNPQHLMARIQSEKRLPFDLTIRDVTNNVNATLKNINLAGKQLSFTAEFPVSLASFNLEPPGVLGIIRVADEVQVSVEVTIESAALAAP